eukprot:9285734-Prorocentrum_lima.AAC.1
MEKGETTRQPTLLLLLDWAKAFDKVLHGPLFSALERLNLPPEYLDATQALYTLPQFYVELDGSKSDIFFKKPALGK